MWERRADTRTKRGEIILTESRVFSSYCRLRKGKSYFIDLACTLHHHVRKCFSYSRFSNPNVVQKIYISTDLLLRWFFFFFFFMAIRKFHNVVYCRFYDHNILSLLGLEIGGGIGEGKDVLSAHRREVHHSKQTVCRIWFIIFWLTEFCCTVS